MSQAEQDKRDELEKTKRSHEKFVGIILAAISGTGPQTLYFRKKEKNECRYYLFICVYPYSS